MVTEAQCILCTSPAWTDDPGGPAAPEEVVFRCTLCGTLFVSDHARLILEELAPKEKKQYSRFARNSNTQGSETVFRTDPRGEVEAIRRISSDPVRRAFVEDLSWLVCRHREVARRPTGEGRGETFEIARCLLAIEDDPTAVRTFGASGCKRAACSYTNRDDVP